MSGLRLGPFELHDRIGRGGMGEVWAAVHPADRRPLAIKVITDARALKERFRAAFRNEARAMASMEHRGIARIHEFGVVDQKTAHQSALRPGTPYLVMERLGAPLDVDTVAGSWPRLRAVLLALLDALAHAHARGLVHRDLKPDNILWALDGRRVKLTDFGVAHAMYGGATEAPPDTATPEWETTGAASSGMVGTPTYMAPEQVLGHIWAQGPWTDLYALGSLAYKVASGRAPFEDPDKPLATMMAHITAPVPPLASRMQIPTGFEAWLGRLLAKSPEARYRKAADAAHALRRLDDAPRLDTDFLPSDTVDAVINETGSLGSIDSIGSLGSLGSLDALSAPGTLDILDALGLADEPSDEGAVHDAGEATEVDDRLPAFAEALREAGQGSIDAGLLETGALPAPIGPDPLLASPLPLDWRDSRIGRSDPRLGGVGLGLYGLRRVPFVGRESERDLLWSMLRASAERRGVHAVMLRGPSGFGKTRLAEWLVERADELGAANGLRAIHGAVDGPGQGLPGLLERALRCVEVPRETLVAHIRRMLGGLGGGDDAHDAEALAEIIAPIDVQTTGGTKAIRFARPEEHHATLRRFFEVCARERPLVVLLDDVQHSRRTLDFCLHLLDARCEAPILLVMTVRDEALAERPDAAALIETLAARDVVELPVGPLASDDRPALLRALLGLDAELARRIDARTGGNALFAVQLIGDWVQRGVLRPSPDGFRLEPGATEAMPADLGSVWHARVEQILADRSGDDVRALEIAATLGLQISGAEWRAACAAAGLVADPALVDALLDAALARSGPEGPAVRWAFVHGMLREAIVQRARAAGRLGLHHRVCARVIARHPATTTAERVARHLLAAHRYSEAAAPLIEAIERRLDEGDIPAARALVDALDGAMSAQPIVDLRRGEGWLLAARLARQRARADQAEALAVRAAEAAERYGWTRLRPAVLFERAMVDKATGRFASAEARLREAGQLAAADDLALRARCSEELGAILVRQGERDRGVAALGVARQAYGATDDLVGLGRCAYWMARVHLAAGELDEASAHNEAAHDAFDQSGARGAAASCRLMDGEIARARRAPAEAATHYREALALFESLGSANAIYARLNLGFALVEAGQSAEARPLLEETLERATSPDLRAVAAGSRAALLLVHAEQRDWPSFSARLGEIETLTREQEVLERDTARLVDQAARRALGAGERTHAAAAAELAGRLWTRLGCDAEAIEARLLTA